MHVMGIISEILHETSKLIHKWRKIFIQITLAFILPFSLSIFAHSTTFNFLILQHTIKTTPKFHKLTQILSSIFSTVFSLLFSLLSTSAVVYTVIRIPKAHDVSFKDVITVLPKLFEQLLDTFLSILAAWLAFNFVAFLVIFFLVLFALLVFGANEAIIFDYNYSTNIIVIFFTIFYVGAFLYLTIIWEMSLVVSVLEESSCGFKAMAKSKALLKGKMAVVAMILFLSLTLSYGILHFMLCNHMSVIVSWVPLGVVGRVIVGIIWFLSFLSNHLIKLVAKTVLYSVCKSYHKEKVDMSALSNHLQGSFLKDYVP